LIPVYFCFHGHKPKKFIIRRESNHETTPSYKLSKSFAVYVKTHGQAGGFKESVPSGRLSLHLQNNRKEGIDMNQSIKKEPGTAATEPSNKDNMIYQSQSNDSTCQQKSKEENNMEGIFNTNSKKENKKNGFSKHIP
jgi:hypothetical protein